MAIPKSIDAFKQSFEAISLLTGEIFFRELVKGISTTLQVEAVWIAEYNKGQNSMTTMAFVNKGNYVANFTYLLDNTPCEKVINSSTVVHFSERLIDLFPRDQKMLSKFNGESYVGSSLHDVNGEVIGNVAILDNKPMQVSDDIAIIIKIIKSRAEAELQRLRREKEILQRENQLRGLINGVQDLLINLDHRGKIVMVNSVAESTLGIDSKEDDLHISQLLSDSSKSKLLTLIETLGNTGHEENYLWISDFLEMKPRGNDMFKAEGTLSRYELDEKVYYTLVLRNQDDKAESDDRIKQLVDETEYLRVELEEIKDSNQLVGESNAMKRLLQNVYMVAHTDATVLINGETGTGKELVARHIHQISNRKNKPMVAVNCGAIPASLMESEFFGHAKGAFTGATAERKGRFQLADGGTIFLDEIGELPLDLQVKLLRVIQEGEVEPVGSSKTITVDVRIIAATHRNLFELIKENRFREDLYYRLNVFPIEVPPLRERNDDVILIANTFIHKFSKRVNKKINPLTEAQKLLLKSYAWPGNIRELQNIMERSVILAVNGVLDLQTTLGVRETSVMAAREADEERILTKDEFLEFEKQNIIRALKAANWKVSGKDGAATLLQMVPSTLSSRIAALGIKMPKV
jgi:transcriptional regulator with GAF, ATPase, and Fis domain